MSFTDPGDFFQGRPGDTFQGRPGDTFDGGTFKARADARNAESHARHERRQQAKADRLASEADAQSRDDLAAMARNDARAFALALGQFRAMMEMCFPALVRLCDQTTSPDSSELFPAVAALGQHGPCWQHPIPEGEEDGQVPVWSEADHAWLPGEGGGINNMSWQAKVEDDGANGLKVNHLGGSVGFFGMEPTWFEGGTHTARNNDAYCYLKWDASENTGKGTWLREIKSSGYPTAAAMDDGDVVIPLWFLKDGVLTQETVGAIVIPAVKNVVDKDETA